VIFIHLFLCCYGSDVGIGNAGPTRILATLKVNTTLTSIRLDVSWGDYTFNFFIFIFYFLFLFFIFYFYFLFFIFIFFVSFCKSVVQ